jgi:hypothetical protein
MGQMDLFGRPPPSSPAAAPQPKRRARRPRRPPDNGVATSVAAADHIAPQAATLRAAVLAAIRATGADGMTCDEVEVCLSMKHQTASARVNELSRGAKIVDSGTSRPTRSGCQAIVWVVR